MANRVKGITIEINGDTTGLSKALSGINKDINSTKSELKDIERLLKLDPTNVELLEQKQKNLAKQIGLTEEKLKALKEAEKQAQDQFKKGEISEQQYDALKREIIATENSLKNAKESAEKTDKALEKAAKTNTENYKKLKEKIEGVNEKLDQIGTKAEKAGKAMKGISLAAGGVAAGIGAMAVKAGLAADDINTLSTQTGISVENLQKFAYASDLIDVSTETLTGSLSKLTKNMSTARKGTGDVADAFKKLHVRITGSGGALRDNEEVFYDTIDALGKVKSETERDALAMTIFGKSAQDLNPLIMGGADALKKYGEEAESAGLILSQDTLNAANEFNNELDEMKAKAKAAFGALGAQLAIELVPVMEKLSDALGVVLGWLSEMDPAVLVIVGGIAALVAGIAPLLILIGQTVTAIKTINTAMLALAANPTVAMVAAITAIVAALIILEQKTQIFSKTFTAIWEGARKTVEKVGRFFIEIFTVKIPNALEKMKSFFKNIWEGIVTVIKAPVNLIIKMLNSLISGINKVFRWANSLKLPDFLGGGSLGFNFKPLADIPMLAKGGVLSKGTAIVGEAGPEALTVKNGKAIVQPLGGGAALSAAGNNYYFNVNANDLQSVADFWRVAQNATRLGRMK